MVDIAVYVHHPYCSWDSASGFVDAMGKDHNCIYFDETKLDDRFLNKFDMVVFPGGLGDVDVFDSLLRDKIDIIQNFVERGGKYLGICMGAYWAGSQYFDLITPEPVQYIKQKDALTKRSYGTVLPVRWNKPHSYSGDLEYMFFYDGCTFKFIENEKFKEYVKTIKNLNDNSIKIIAWYGDYGDHDMGHPAAIIEGNVGAIGPHPESNKYWYESWSYMPQFWHHRRHHKILKQFVTQLLVS